MMLTKSCCERGVKSSSRDPIISATIYSKSHLLVRSWRSKREASGVSTSKEGPYESNLV